MPQHENIFPAPDTLNELEYGKFVLANLAAKRAKQIKDGAPPLVRISSNHALSIALAEIAAGKIKPILTHDQNVPVEAHDDLVTLGNIDMGDGGLLLPAFDEDEVDLLSRVTSGTFEDDEEHTDEEEEAGADSLAELLGTGEDEAEEAVTESSGNEISLDDLAEEEEAEAEEESE